MNISLKNRERIANEIVHGAVLIHGNKSVYRNNDVAYPFRQDSNFHYLTEWPEPDAHAVILIKASKPELYLFVQDRNLEMETWDGKELPSEEVISSYDNIEASVTTDLIRGSRVDAVLVALASHILNVSSLWSSRKFAIDLLQGTLAELESDEFKENGNKLN